MGSSNRRATTKTDFDQSLPGIVTHLVGKIGLKEINEWAQSFQQCRDNNVGDHGFKLLVNTYGYEPVSLEVHKRWRQTLVEYCENRCIAIAFVNHDPMQVTQMQKTATKTHNFFMDINEAYRWLREASQNQ
jgi:hypothetical protein